MTENHKKWWKLALIGVPIVVSNIGSYTKSRAESKDETKASYEALRGAVEELKKTSEEAHKDSEESRQHIVVLEGQVSLLKDLLDKTTARAPTHASAFGNALEKPVMDKDGISDDAGLPFVHQKPVGASAALPEKFEDVVQQYKDKK